MRWLQNKIRKVKIKYTKSKILKYERQIQIMKSRSTKILSMLITVTLIMCAVYSVILTVIYRDSIDFGLSLIRKLLTTYTICILAIIVIYFAGRYNSLISKISCIVLMLTCGILCINMSNYYGFYKTVEPGLKVFVNEAGPVWNSSDKDYESIPDKYNIINATVVLYKGLLNYTVDMATFLNEISKLDMDSKNVELIYEKPEFYNSTNVVEYLGPMSIDNTIQFSDSKELNDYLIKEIENTGIIKDVHNIQSLTTTATKLVQSLSFVIVLLLFCIIIYKQRSTKSLYKILNEPSKVKRNT